jgi:transcriptional regulator with GAF, ATPase, and Fis domain/CHASE2 domain-containing sensor protein
MTRSPLLLGALIALPVVLLSYVLLPVTSPVEDLVTAWKYRVRGAERADSNVVIIYIDNEAVRTMGWPVRRNFHALMLHALADLHPRAIGLDVVFEDQKSGYGEFSEYDTLLTEMVRQAGSAVLASYFESIDQSSPDTGTLHRVVPVYPRLHGNLLAGHTLHLPFPALVASAAGVGHVNFSGNGGVAFPAVVASSAGVVPAFALDIFRVAIGASRSDVWMGDDLVLLDHTGRERHIPVSSEGIVHLSFPGSLDSFTHYAFLDVLRSYDAARHGGTESVPVESLKGKIVLVGVIAEGRSEFRSTPVDPRTPTIVTHATFLDNALGGKFPVIIGQGWGMVVLALAAFFCACAVLAFRRPLNMIIALLVPVVVIGASLVVFVFGRVSLPIVATILAAVVSSVAALLVRWRREGKQVDELSAEKTEILTRLHDREAKVALLEEELLNRQDQPTKVRAEELLGEIRRYKAEIYDLTTQAQDMEVFTAGEDATGTAEEFEHIVYARSGAMKAVVEFVKKIAASDAPVLVLGESGTGKELVARAIHGRSGRAAGPFIAVNCGALAENLLESELFGHEKGAFTGAVRERLGRFELADNGTIFLDELGEVSEAFQLKLLRVLQEGEFERVGGTRTIKVNVRIVAATNKDLREEVARKRFREDLYYRINVLTVSLPPLRERQSDTEILVRHFLAREEQPLAISRGVMEILQTYAWPGNVRELESAVRRAVLLARADGRQMIVARDLPDELAASFRGTVPVQDRVLDLVRGRGFSRSAVSDAAVELGGLNRGTVAEYLRGEFLKVFMESEFKKEEAVRRLALSTDQAVLARVRKRLEEYLSNIAAAVDIAQPWELSRSGLKPKMKNLPQRYHEFVDRTGEAYYRGRWRLDEGRP